MGKVLHGSKSGFFPSCFRTDPEFFLNEAGTCLVSMPLTKAMESFWRVKKWQISWSFNGEDGAGDPHSGSAVTTLDMALVHGLSSEADLVCDPIEASGQSAYRWVNLEMTATTGTGVAYTRFIQRSITPGDPKGWVFSDGQAVTTQSNVSFLQACYIEDGSWVDVGSDYEIVMLASAVTQRSGWLRYATGGNGLSLNGVTMTGTAEYPVGAGTGLIASLDFSFSITPSEYWSYGGTYDTATGLPL